MLRATHRPGGSSRGGMRSVQHPHAWPVWFHPLVTPASSFGLSPLGAPSPMLGATVYRALAGGGPLTSEFANLWVWLLGGSFLKRDCVLVGLKSPDLEGLLCPPFSPVCAGGLMPQEGPSVLLDSQHAPDSVSHQPPLGGRPVWLNSERERGDGVLQHLVVQSHLLSPSSPKPKHMVPGLTHQDNISSLLSNHLRCVGTLGLGEIGVDEGSDTGRGTRPAAKVTPVLCHAPFLSQ